jgi:hypothetical protein
MSSQQTAAQQLDAALSRSAMCCARCGRYLSPDTCLEGVDWSQGSMGLDGDWPYTGLYYCAHGLGCNADEAVA